MTPYEPDLLRMTGMVSVLFFDCSSPFVKVHVTLRSSGVSSHFMVFLIMFNQLPCSYSVKKISICLVAIICHCNVVWVHKWAITAMCHFGPLKENYLLVTLNLRLST